MLERDVTILLLKHLTPGTVIVAPEKNPKHSKIYG